MEEPIAGPIRILSASVRTSWVPRLTGVMARVQQASSSARLTEVREPDKLAKLREEFPEARLAADDCLIPLGAGGDATDLHSGTFFQVRQIIAGLQRQRFVARNA